LARLRTALRGQAEALAADDFAAVERFAAERDELVAALDWYTPADATAADRALLEQLSALDQRLLEAARSGLEQASHDLREVHRGRTALNEYQRRGQNLIRNLSLLDLEG